jgi:Fe-S-cluster containining protein
MQNKTDPRFTELDTIHRKVDEAYAKAIENSKMKPACGMNCPGCCKEPVYADRIEAERILASLTMEQVEELKPKLVEWLRRFYASGLQQIEEPNVYQYRALNLPCPLLSGSLCGVYPVRPMACRTHFALRPKKYCDDDVLRHQQKYALNQDIVSKAGQMIAMIQNHGVYDHLCVLLGELLFGRQPETASRAEYTVTTS